MSTNGIKIGILGHCPVCEGEYKTHDGKMVHHGYQRPGDGQIHGDCFAVKYPAYELSTLGCEAYRVQLKVQKAVTLRALDNLPSTTYFSKQMFDRRTRAYLGEKQWALGVTDPYEWRVQVQKRESQYKYELEKLEMGIERMEKRIAAWTLQPLKEVTEAMAIAQSKAEKAARAAERDSKRLAKDEKARALKAKREAKEAQRAAFVRAFYESVLASPVHARSLSIEFRSKKNVRLYGEIYYLNEYLTEEEGEKLIPLGLADKSSYNGRVRYTF